MKHTQLTVIGPDGSTVAVANVLRGENITESLRLSIEKLGVKQVIANLSMIRDWYSIDSGARQRHPSTRRSGTFQGRHFMTDFGVVARPFEICGRPTSYCRLDLSNNTISHTVTT